MLDSKLIRTITMHFASLVYVSLFVFDGSAASLKNAREHIKHVIIIMQENRSFDNYFGTYPGASGFPKNVCVPLDPSHPKMGCVTPFHDPKDIDAGGVHSAVAAAEDLDDGITQAKMDGFVQLQIRVGARCWRRPLPVCIQYELGRQSHDAIGYHTDAEIPNYWSYAQHFVLQDHLFAGYRSWSLPSHLDLVSEWVAVCTDPQDAMTCTGNDDIKGSKPTLTLPWANFLQLLDMGGVSWKYYVGQGVQPDCPLGDADCLPASQAPLTPSAWNPVGYFTSVKAQGSAYLQLHNAEVSQFFADIEAGTLPSVAWIVPNGPQSEHAPNTITAGMVYVTSLINAIAASPYWIDTAIFLTWDDWGGFYDHVIPPNLDLNPMTNQEQGFGLRVPGLLISAYAKSGIVDHHVLSFDNYAAFIEDLFLNSTRLDPAAMGNPDNRPEIRDSLTSVSYYNGTTSHIGDLLEEFDFGVPPQPPLILPTSIPTNIDAECGASSDSHYLCTSSTVTISWSALTSSQGTPPFTYTVTRDNPPVTVCSTANLSCTDTPGSGAHFYRVTSTDAGGTQGPPSAASEAVEP